MRSLDFRYATIESAARVTRLTGTGKNSLAGGNAFMSNKAAAGGRRNDSSLLSQCGLTNTCDGSRYGPDSPVTGLQTPSLPGRDPREKPLLFPAETVGTRANAPESDLPARSASCR